MPEITPSQNFRLHQLFLNLRRIGVREWNFLKRWKKRNWFFSPLGPDLNNKNLV